MGSISRTAVVPRVLAAMLVLAHGSCAVRPPWRSTVRAGAPRPRGALATRLVVQSAHTGRVSILAWRPDGAVVATAGDDGEVRLWEARSGALLAALPIGARAYGARVRHVAWSPDGRLLAASTSSDVAIVEVDTGEFRRRLRGSQEVAAVAFDPSGARLLIAYQRNGMRIVSVTGGTDREVAAAGAEVVIGAAWSPGGDHIATGGSDGQLRLWDAATGALRATLRGHQGQVSALAWRDATTLAAGDSEGGIRSWDARAGASLAVILPSGPGVGELAWSRDGRSLWWSTANGELRVTGERTPRARIRAPGTENAPSRIAPDGARIAYAVGRGPATIASGRGPDLLAEPSPTSGSIVAFAWSGDGSALAYGRDDGGVEVIDAARARLRWSRSAHDDWCATLALSPDGRTLATGGGDRLLRVWELAGGRLEATYQTSGPIRHLAWHPGGAMLASGGEGFEVWDVRAGTRLVSEGRAGAVLALTWGARRLGVLRDLGPPLAWSGGDRGAVALSGPMPETVFGWQGLLQAAWLSDGETLVAGGISNRLYRYSAARAPEASGSVALGDELIVNQVVEEVAGTGGLRARETTAINAIYRVSVSPRDGRVATIAADGRVRILDPAAREVVRVMSREVHAGYPALAWSPDGSQLAVLRREALLWEPSSDRVAALDASDVADASHVSWSPDGRRVGVGGRGAAKVFELDGLRALARAGTGGPVQAWRWREDDVLVASAGAVQGLTLTRVADDSRMHVNVFPAPGGTLAFTEDGLFDGDASAFDRVTYRLGSTLLRAETVTAGQLTASYLRPGLLGAFLRGEDLGAPDVAGLPPSVELAALPAAIEGTALRVRGRVVERGGGIGDVRVYVNGVRAGGERGLVVARDGGAGRSEFSVEVWLQPGENVIVAQATSAHGGIEGPRVTVRVRSQAAEDAERAELHLLALSVNRYRFGPDLAYANADADAVVQAFERQAGGLYGRVRVTRLRDDGVSLARVREAFGAVASAVRPKDVFVLFVAGHGDLVACAPAEPERFYALMFDSNLRDPQSVCGTALADGELAALVRSVRTSKKVILLDTCHAGAMASPEMVIAMRGGTEVAAIRRLARAEGLAILASATESQGAAEFAALGHGLFSYALIEALQGRALPEGVDDVTVDLLNGYVMRRVEELSLRFHRSPQTPIRADARMDFPLARRLREH